jgi:hypothetical protein
MEDERSFVVNYFDGKKDFVKAVPWKDLKDVQTLQIEILKFTVLADGHLGDLWCSDNKSFWEVVSQLSKLMPVVGRENRGINPFLIRDVDELTRIFISIETKRHNTTGGLYTEKDEELLPSEIARINSLNFSRLLVTANQMILSHNQKPS